MSKTIAFFPEGAYGPTNNCVGIGQVLAGAGPPRRVRDRGVLRRQPRGAGLRGTADAARPAARGRGGARPVLEGLHPRHVAGLPQADDRAVERVHRAHLPCALRRLALRRRTAARDLRRAAAGRDRRGQRRRLPRDRPLREALGAPAFVQSARAERPCDRAGLLRLRGRTATAGTLSGPSTSAHTRICTRSSAPSATSGAPGRCPGASSCTSRPGSTSTCTRPRSTTRVRSRSLRHGIGSTRPFGARTPGSSFPRRSQRGEGRLVYLSLGSLGSADVELMRRLVDVLSRSPHRFIVSKGPQADEYALADNMWGAEFLPQPALMPLVDAVITHGGNNTTTECFHFGKPMIVLPLFWDQYDNAQRVDETGFGTRLDDLRVRGSRAARRGRARARRHGSAGAAACDRGACSGSPRTCPRGRPDRAARRDRATGHALTHTREPVAARLLTQ